MTHEEMIAQLESLRAHCREMIHDDEPDDIWRDDVEALNAAIDAMKGAKPMTQIILWSVGIVVALLATAIVLVCMIVGDDRKG